MRPLLQVWPQLPLERVSVWFEAGLPRDCWRFKSEAGPATHMERTRPRLLSRLSLLLLLTSGTPETGTRNDADHGDVCRAASAVLRSVTGEDAGPVLSPWSNSGLRCMSCKPFSN